MELFASESWNSKYKRYLTGREWGKRKRAVHERAYGMCERCFVNPIAAVHHLTYERVFNEPLEDLEGHCHECHEYTHGKCDMDPRMFGAQAVLRQPPEPDAMPQFACPRCKGVDVTLIGGGVSESSMGAIEVRGTMQCACGLLFDLCVSSGECGAFLHYRNFRLQD